MCDVVENGLSKRFNGVIRDARKNLITTMLEEIRMYVTERIFNLNIKGSTWPNSKSCATITLLLNELQRELR